MTTTTHPGAESGELLKERAATKRRNNTANGPIVLAVAALFVLALPLIPRSGQSPLAHLLILFLIVRFTYLGFTPRLGDPYVPTILRAVIWTAAFIGLFFLEDVVPQLFYVGDAFPFMLLAMWGLAVTSRRSPNNQFVSQAALLSLAVFVQSDTPWWGIVFGAATAAIAHLAFHQRLRGDDPLHQGDRPGGLLAAALMGVALLTAAFWFSTLSPLADNDFETSGGATADSTSTPSSGGDSSGGTPGSGDGGAYETRPDGSIVFVPLQPGDSIPAGTVVVQQTEGGFGTPDGNGFVACQDGELIYDELEPGETAPEGATPMIRRAVTDRKGDGRILECTPLGASIRPLEPGEEVPATAVEILKDDGRFDDVPRIEPEERPQESDPINIPWLPIFIGLCVLAAGAYIWHRSRIPWLTKTLRTFDRVGTRYGRTLHDGESLQSFAADLPGDAKALAQEIATELDQLAFSDQFGPADDSAKGPRTEVTDKVDALILRLKAQSRSDRNARLQQRGSTFGRRAPQEAS